MCLTEIGTVVAHADDSTLVRLHGRERWLPNLTVPGVRPGDPVVVGMGLVLGRPADGTAPRDDGHLPNPTNLPNEAPR
jgi:hypothetical protein